VPFLDVLAVVLGLRARLDHGLGLDDLAGDAVLRVLLGALLLLRLGVGLAPALLGLLAAAALGLALCARLRH
jgi:hypothetical protein